MGCGSSCSSCGGCAPITDEKKLEMLKDYQKKLEEELQNVKNTIKDLEKKD